MGGDGESSLAGFKEIWVAPIPIPELPLPFQVISTLIIKKTIWGKKKF